MNLQSIEMRRLLPAFMQRQTDDTAIAESLSAAVRAAAGNIARLSTWDALDTLSEGELDSLADECMVGWYDKRLNIEQKRAILADSDKMYMRLGTLAACEQIVTDIFGKSTIREFWEYSTGKPHHFAIEVEDASTLSAEAEAKLIRMMSHVQRRSQWLDYILATTRTAQPFRAGVHLAKMMDMHIRTRLRPLAATTTAGGDDALPHWVQIAPHHLAAAPLLAVDIPCVDDARAIPNEPQYLACWESIDIEQDSWNFIGYSSNAVQSERGQIQRWNFPDLPLTGRTIRFCPIPKSVYAPGDVDWYVESSIPGKIIHVSNDEGSKCSYGYNYPQLINMTLYYGELH